MTILRDVEPYFAGLGLLTFLSFIGFVLLIVDDRRVNRRRARERALHKHPACATHDWDAAFAALIANTPEEK